MNKKIAKVLLNHSAFFSTENISCIKSQLMNCPIDFYFVCPNKLKNSFALNSFIDLVKSWNLSQNFYIIFLDDYYFSSIVNYSELLCSEYFYTHFFSKYEYILILQPDVWITDNSLIFDLIKVCDREKIDFIGAPLFFIHDEESILNAFFKWNKLRTLTYKITVKICRLGLFPKKYLLDIFFTGVNGGSSLRRVEPFYQISKNLSKQTIVDYWLKYTKAKHIFSLNGYFNEDIFWSIIIGKKMGFIKVARNSTCAKYFWELGEVEILKHFVKPRLLPFSIHKFYKDFNLNGR